MKVRTELVNTILKYYPGMKLREIDRMMDAPLGALSKIKCCRAIGLAQAEWMAKTHPECADLRDRIQEAVTESKIRGGRKTARTLRKRKPKARRLNLHCMIMAGFTPAKYRRMA